MNARRILPITKWLVALVVVLMLLPCPVMGEPTAALNDQFLEAAARGDLEQIESLLNRGANGDARDKRGRTALMLAARNIHVEVVKLLLGRGVDANARDHKGETALESVARFESGDMMRLSLEKGSDGKTLTKDYWTTFAETVWKRRSEVLRLLKVYGAEVTLTVAALLGDTGEVRRLLEMGSDVNGKDGLTPLMGAAGRGHADIVQLLLDKGADVNARGKKNMTALMGAAGIGYSDFSSVTVVTGMNDLMARMDGSRTAHAHVVRLLLEKGADVNAMDDNGVTALMGAAGRGNADAVKSLLDKGADVNAKDKHGVTVLMWAVRMREMNVMKLLIEKGADVNAKSRSGWTALEMARMQKDREIVELLEAHGGKQ